MSWQPGLTRVMIGFSLQGPKAGFQLDTFLEAKGWSFKHPSMWQGWCELPSVSPSCREQIGIHPSKPAIQTTNWREADGVDVSIVCISGIRCSLAFFLRLTGLGTAGHRHVEFNPLETARRSTPGVFLNSLNFLKNNYVCGQSTV